MEMTIEEKAKAYDEALRVLHKYDGVNILFSQSLKEEMFPELADSEDERIRKDIVEAVELHKDFTQERKEQIYAWLEKQVQTFTKKDIDDAYLKGICDAKRELEKQGEQKLLNNDKYQTVPVKILDRLYESEKELERLKQSEQKVPVADFKAKDWYVSKVDGKIYDMTYNPTDKVEPKFKVGDWTVENEPNNYARFIQILEIIDVQGKKRYRISRDLHNDEDVAECRFIENNYHSFTIQDAKDGDVLCRESGWTCIFKALDNHTNTFSSYCFMDSDKWFCNTGSECHTLDKVFIKAYNGEIYPATKEQRDTLMKAMADAGYTFDFEKKELKKIEQKPWSEEDEKYLKLAIENFQTLGNSFLTTWLKSLKDRVQPQPKQEWSEDTQQWIDAIIKDYENLYDADKDHRATIQAKINILKSLRPQSTWKPSDEQMENLSRAFNGATYNNSLLMNLYIDLKKLKE